MEFVYPRDSAKVKGDNIIYHIVDIMGRGGGYSISREALKMLKSKKKVYDINKKYLVVTLSTTMYTAIQQLLCGKNHIKEIIIVPQEGWFGILVLAECVYAHHVYLILCLCALFIRRSTNINHSTAITWPVTEVCMTAIGHVVDWTFRTPSECMSGCLRYKDLDEESKANFYIAWMDCTQTIFYLWSCHGAPKNKCYQLLPPESRLFPTE